MNLQSHFMRMSDYNQRMNRQIYNVVKELDEREINDDRGAYFRSIIGTLNHILVGDLIWLRRFAKHSNRYKSLVALSDFPNPQGLDDIIFSSFPLLLEARDKVDLSICTWLKNETIGNDFDKLLEYSNTKGEVSQRDFGELVSHFFNHQTHHRGQLSTLLNQMNLDVGTTDYLFEIPENKT